MLKAGAYAFRDRRAKKRSIRGLWQIQIGAVCKEVGTSYSKFMGALKAGNITLDRKILSTLAKEHPQVFAKVMEKAKVVA